MENLEYVLSIAVSALGLLITALTFIAKNVKISKAKKTTDQTLEITTTVLPSLMEAAKKHVEYSDEEKKEYVLTKASQYAVDNGISFNKKVVEEKIEQLFYLSKNVNVTSITTQTQLISNANTATETQTLSEIEIKTEKLNEYRSTVNTTKIDTIL